MHTDNSAVGEHGFQGRLLRTLAEELKLPLMQIARLAELARITGEQKQIEQAEVLADTTLKLLDSYVLSTQTMLGQQMLHLEPVSLSATLYDTAQYLHKLAKLYDCDIDLSVKGKFGLVMAHPGALQSAMMSLGYSFINAVSGLEKKGKAEIILSAKRNQHGVATGIYTSNQEIGSTLMKQAKELYGVARQPMAQRWALLAPLVCDCRLRRSHRQGERFWDAAPVLRICASRGAA